MKSPAAPPPPNTNNMVQDQTAANVAAAKTTQQMNMVDQSTPYGSVNYTQQGNWADGTPRFSSSVTLSPQEQAKQDQQWQFDKLVNDLGISQTQKLQGHLDKPISLGNEATEARLMELGNKRLQPQLDQRRAALETKLYNQGVMPGTEAYDRAMRENSNSENDAYTQLLLGGRSQAVQEGLTERNQPINEITALMSGGQVQQPSFMNTPTAQVAAADVIGANQLNYQAQQNAYNQQMGRNNALYGAIGSMAGTALGGWASGGFKGFK